MDELSKVIVDIMTTRITGIPVTDEQWLEFIGAGPKARKATMEAYEASKRLAKELQEQEWQRMSTRKPE